MKFLTEDTALFCAHETGQVGNLPSQDFVTVHGRRVLVATDPEGRRISGCTNTNPPVGIKPCSKTLRAFEGYSSFIHIAGKAVCLDTVTGLTDGTPPGAVIYSVRNSGQSFVDGAS
jgi:hypothetical protein